MLRSKSFIIFAERIGNYCTMKQLQLNKRIPTTTRKKITSWWHLCLFLVASLTMGAIIIDYGYIQHPYENEILENLYNNTWWIYCLSYLFSILTYWKQMSGKRIITTIVWGILLASIGISKFITLPPAYDWLGHRLLEVSVLGLFSFLLIARGIMRFINKKTNPALLMAIGFAMVIGLGTLLLLLPRSTHEGIILSAIDALFVSTSAVCVTGLTPIDVTQFFTLEGQLIIALLIQVGGLGIMTITSFFALFYMGGSALHSQFALRDLVGSDTFSSLLSTLVNILLFTFIIESIGAFFIWLSIHNTLDMTWQQEVFCAFFHAVSAFCNAGFSNLEGNLGNPAVITGHNAFLWLISILVVLGGLGFPVLMNLKRTAGYYIGNWFKRTFKHKQPDKLSHLAQINTKIVLVTTAILLVGGTFLIAFLEWNDALKGIPVIDKITHSFFNAVSPRTAGFNTLSIAHFSLLSILLYMLLMWIGGGSQSTAGGIKVNTLAVMLANFVSMIKGRKHVVLFHREIADNSIKRASAVVIGSIVCILFFFVVLLVLEPHLSPLGLLFETLSAYSTVGASMDITAQLSNASKVVVTVLMFIGRVGFITLLMSFIKTDNQPKYRYPQDHIIIN